MPAAAPRSAVLEERATAPPDFVWRLSVHQYHEMVAARILNLRARRLEVYTEPLGPVDDVGYRRRREVALEGSVGLEIDGVAVGEIMVRELVP